MITLLPRLPVVAGDQMLDDLLIASNGIQLSTFGADSLPGSVRYASTGGSRVTPAQLMYIRESIVSIARECGFAEQRPNTSKFDSSIAIWLATCELFKSAEALRDDVWACLSIAIVPDVVHWRFGKSRQRYLGGVRNTFQRLWQRSVVFDRGPDSVDRWEVLTTLTEDALVQICERPSIGGDPRLALEVGEAWIRASKKFGRSSMESTMRQAALRIRVLNEVRSLSALPDLELVSLMDSIFEQASLSESSEGHDKRER